MRMLDRRVSTLVLASAVVTGAFGVRAQAKEPTFEYVVRPGDTCASIAEGVLGDKRRWPVIHEHNPGMGPIPHRLKPGSVLILPVQGRGPDARLTDVRRQVQTRAPREPNWQQALAGKELFRGWRVNTLDKAAADVTFHDGSIVQMRQNTLIIIYGGISRPTRRRTTEATLERGSLRSRLGELRLDVKTPNAEAGLDGGSSVVRVDDEGTSYLSHHDGPEAQFKLTKGEAVRVKPGFGSKARKGDRRPSKPRPLPTTPRWEDDAPQLFVGTSLTGGGSIRGSWTPVEVATAYRVEIARGKDGEDVVVATTVPAAVTHLEVHRLPEGQYQARVSAIDAGGLESPRSSPRPMRVRLLTLHGPGLETVPETREGEGSIGAPPPTPTVLPGTRLVSPVGLRCGPPQEAKVESVELVRDGMHQLSCVGSDGVSSSELEVLVAAPTMQLVEPVTDTLLVRGAEPRTFIVAVESELTLPDDARLRVRPEGTRRETAARGRRTVLELAATEQDPDELALELVVGQGASAVVLASIGFDVIDPPVLDFAPNEALGLALSPNLLGLRNDRREGSGPFTTLAYRDGPSAGESRWRLNIGAEVSPIRRLRLGIAVPVDVAESPAGAAGETDQGILTWVEYRILMRHDLSLQTTLSVWFPATGSEGSIPRTRFLPSVEASYVLGRRWLFRTRQGAILNTGTGGPFAWASAYGLDVKLVRRLAISGELDVVLGRSAGRAVTGVGGGPGLSLLLGPARLYFGARFAATDDFQSTNGNYTLTGGLRLAFE